jgi:6-phosphogluconolactonase (cycloisomerase 2 family)
MHLRIGCWSVAGAIAGLAITAGIPSAAAANDFLTPVSGSPFSVGGSASDPQGLAFSADGLRLVVADDNGGGAGQLSSFTVGGDGTLASPAGSPFSTASSAAFEVAVSSTGIVALIAQDNSVSTYTYSTDGTLTAVGSPLATGNYPDGVAFSPDGSLLAVVDGGAHDLEIFTVSAGGVLTPASTIAAGLSPNDVTFSGDGQLIAVSDNEGNVYTYTVTSDGIATQVGDQNRNAASVAFRPGTSQLAVGEFGPDQVELFDVAPDGTLTPISAAPMSVNDYPQSISFSPGGDLVAIAAEFDLELYSLAPDGSPTPVPGSPLTPADSGNIGAGTFNPSGTLLTYTSEELNIFGSPEYLDNDVNVVAVTQPTATITSPSDGQTFVEGDTAPTTFSCTDSASVSISSCTDFGGASSGSGTLDTSHPGTFTYTVTATDAYGQTAQATRSYTVTAASATTTTTTTSTTPTTTTTSTTPTTTVPADTTPTTPTVAPTVPGPVRVLTVQTRPDGAVVIPVRVPARGTFYVTATTGSGARRRTFSNRFPVGASRPVHVGPRADAWLRRLIGHSGHRMTMMLTVHYTAGGTTRTVIQHKVTITG